LNKASQNLWINQIELFGDFSKLKKMILLSYSKAPYFNVIMKLIDEIVSFDNSNLAVFLENSITIICGYLKIGTNIICSSAIKKNNELKGEAKIMHICKKLGAANYLNAIGGIDLYNKAEFESNGIDIHFLKTNLSTYKQFNNDFIPGLSIIDMIMFNSVTTVQEMLEDYELV
ncbi:MAG: WbqC family protein, partial [Oscillospiraceae bacterium]|nr:WbqC family protein [Oscillospiraceae bacterium]